MLLVKKELPIVAIKFVQHIQSTDTVTAMFFKFGFNPCFMR